MGTNNVYFLNLFQWLNVEKKMQEENDINSSKPPEYTSETIY